MPANILFRESYVDRVQQASRLSSLIGYWPLFEGAGTFVKGYGSPLENLVNGGFETAGAGGADIWDTWVETAGDGALANETSVVYAGSDAAKVTAGATANTKVAQTFVAVPGTAYTLSFATQGDGTNGGRYLVFDATGGANIIATTATGVTAAAYSIVTVSFTAPANCVSIRLDLMCPAANGGICYFDAVSIMAVANGKYTGVALGQPGVRDGLSSPLFDGSTSYANVYGAGLVQAFNGATGTLLVWVKMASASVWADAAFRVHGRINADASNFVAIFKDSAANTMTAQYRAGGTLETLNATRASTSWLMFALTWDKPNDRAIFYVDGAQVGAAATSLGVWVGLPASSQTIIGATSTAPTLVHSGTIAHAALWSVPLSPAQISYLAAVT